MQPRRREDTKILSAVARGNRGVSSALWDARRGSPTLYGGIVATYYPPPPIRALQEQVRHRHGLVQVRTRWRISSAPCCFATARRSAAARGTPSDAWLEQLLLAPGATASVGSIPGL